MNSIKPPGLPNAPATQDPLQGQWQQQITDALQVGLGQRGQQGQSFVRWDQLVAGNVVIPNKVPGGDYIVKPPPPPDLNPPPAVLNVSAQGGLTAIYIRWDDPALQYDWYAEVSRSDQDDVGTAAHVGTTNGFIYQDTIDADNTLFYYWVRLIKNVAGIHVVGPWHGTQGVSAKVSLNPSWLLDQIEKKLGKEHLSEELAKDIAQIPVLETSINEEKKVRAREDLQLASRVTTVQSTLQTNINTLSSVVQTETEARTTQDQALASSLSTIQTHLNNVSGSVQTNASAITSVKGDITSIRTEYSVKLDSAGYVGGFGLINNNNKVSALFRVDLFAIGSPGKTSLAFAVDGNRVVMDGAYIKDATIQDAQIGSLTVDKLIGGKAEWVEANIRDGAITNAKIGNVLHSGNYQSGIDGWVVNKNGMAEFNNIIARGRVSGSVIEGSLIEGSLFIDPERESVIPTEADTGAYPRYLTLINNYLRTTGVAPYSGNEYMIATNIGRTRTTTVFTCPIKAANYTAEGGNKNVYYNQIRFEKYSPWLVLSGTPGDTADSLWCTGPFFQDSEPRQPRGVKFVCTFMAPGQVDFVVTFYTDIRTVDLGDNDGNSWSKGSSTASAQGFTLTFFYRGYLVHGRGINHFTFNIEGRYPYTFKGNGSITAKFYIEWTAVRGGSHVGRVTTFKNISFGGRTRT